MRTLGAARAGLGLLHILVFNLSFCRILCRISSPSLSISLNLSLNLNLNLSHLQMPRVTVYTRCIHVQPSPLVRKEGGGDSTRTR